VKNTLPRLAVATLSLAALPLAVLTACGSSTNDDDAGSSSGSSSGMSGGGGEGGIDRARLPMPIRPDASCFVEITTPPLMESPHIPEGATPMYNSNPPSSGPHFPVWANFQEHGVPINRGYLVHSLEHGGVLLLYKCDQQPCPTIVEGLRKVRDGLPNDPLCDPSIRVRVVIAPDPALDVPVAAAAWGWTYRAQCFDEPTLAAFVKDHYAQGTENTCAAGRGF
jgi:hypothetical protein